ncbi:hypothetical protein M5X00_09780 [Paenibacillus alvei]|uniref:hypothetical protein n=1 Tax=Paenibacillus alvei TaxID=44250 RepID=UPI0002E37908|nr:hypothetical protein [Paenibacillus alvei]MCY9703523.1 hypothetical protein [Paenibacillus alvei]MCY9754538.1 hypothetical protein [Paenibacillus alvei]
MSKKRAVIRTKWLQGHSAHAAYTDCGQSVDQLNNMKHYGCLHRRTHDVALMMLILCGNP